MRRALLLGLLGCAAAATLAAVTTARWADHGVFAPQDPDPLGAPPPRLGPPAEAAAAQPVPPPPAQHRPGSVGGGSAGDGDAAQPPLRAGAAPLPPAGREAAEGPRDRARAAVAALQRESLRWGEQNPEGAACGPQLDYYFDYVSAHQRVRRVAQIGFNWGAGAATVLAARGDISMVSFDLGEHAYVRPCAKLIDELFPGRHELVVGDSRETLPLQPAAAFDLVIIDGGHSPEVARSDFLESRRIAAPGGTAVMDDLLPGLEFGAAPTQVWQGGAAQGVLATQEVCHVLGRLGSWHISELRKQSAELARRRPIAMAQSRLGRLALDWERSPVGALRRIGYRWDQGCAAAESECPSRRSPEEVWAAALGAARPLIQAASQGNMTPAELYRVPVRAWATWTWQQRGH